MLEHNLMSSFFFRFINEKGVATSNFRKEVITNERFSMIYP